MTTYLRRSIGVERPSGADVFGGLLPDRRFRGNKVILRGQRLSSFKDAETGALLLGLLSETRVNLIVSPLDLWLLRAGQVTFDQLLVSVFLKCRFGQAPQFAA
jgi:hypothetical protein